MSLIRKDLADEFIRAVEDASKRRAIELLLDGVIGFYSQDSSRLRGSFDLAFFVQVLTEVIGRIAGLLQGTERTGFWYDEPATLLPVDDVPDSSSAGLRMDQAFNYAATRSDQRIEALLYDLRWQAFIKQELLSGRVKKDRRKIPATPGAPSQPFDFLFMVMAVDHALMPGQPARLALEEKS